MSHVTTHKVVVQLDEGWTLSFDVPLKTKFTDLLPLIQQQTMVFIDATHYSFVLNYKSESIAKKKKRKFVVMTDVVTERAYNKEGSLQVHIFPPIQRSTFFSHANNLVKKVFGAPLDVFQTRLYLSGHSTRVTLPPFLVAAFQFLEKHGLDEQGIFRLSGNQNAQTTLVQQCNAGMYEDPIIEGKVKLDDDFYKTIFSPKTDPHLVASLVKRYLRELPEPLLTPYETFIELCYSLDDKLNKLKFAIEMLPISNYHVLSRLLQLCRKIASPEHVEKSKMTIENIGIVIGPNILRNEKVEANDTLLVNEITGYLLENYDSLFNRSMTVSGDDSTELRVLHLKQQRALHDQLTQKEMVIKQLEEKVKSVESRKEELQMNVMRLKTTVTELEQQVEKSAKGEISADQVKMEKEARRIKEDLFQLEQISKMITEQEATLYKILNKT